MRVRVSVKNGRIASEGEHNSLGADFQNPLPASAAKDLRFYLEEFPRLPVAAFAMEAARVESTELDAWGAALRDLVQSASGSDCGEIDRTTSLVIESNCPTVHAIPWELCHDDEGSRFVLSGGNLERAIGPEEPSRTGAKGRPLRLLLVIARPSGISDLPHQLMAKHILETNARFLGPMDITVLRPPTFAAFQKCIAEAADAGTPFDIVHFDGHGVFDDDALVATLQFEAATPGDGADAVSAEALGAAIRAGGGIELLLINACRSAFLAADAPLEASIGPALLAATDCAAVVAMSHVVRARAAEIFVETFYGALLSGHTVSAAVSRGRRAMAETPDRPTICGPIPLQDWMIPVLFSRAPLKFEMSAASETADSDRFPGPRIVGRDVSIMQLERAFSQGNSVFLFGPIGIGKSAVAREFERWTHATRWFANTPPDHSRTVWFDCRKTAFPDLLKHLRDALQNVGEPNAHPPSLFIVDDFECLRYQLIGLQQQDSLDLALSLETAFNDAVKAFERSLHKLLIVSRSPEIWVEGVTRVHLGPLDQDAVAELGASILPDPTVWRAPEMQKLIDRCAGHPQVLVSTLPLLETLSPKELLAQFDADPANWVDGFAQAVTAQRLDNSLGLLPNTILSRSPLAATLLETLDPSLLVTIFMVLADGHPFKGDPPEPQAHEILTAWLDFGLAWHIDGEGRFVEDPGAVDTEHWTVPLRLHPLFPARAARLGHTAFKEDYASIAEDTTRAVIEARRRRCEYLLVHKQTDRDAEKFFTLLYGQFDTYERADEEGLRRGLHDASSSIGSALASIRRSQGDRTYEANRAENLLSSLSAPSPGQPLSEEDWRWIGVMGNEGKRYLDAGQLNDAEDIFRSLVSLLEDNTSARETYALACRFMGQVFAKRTTMNDAKEALHWLKKSEEIARQDDLKDELAKSLSDAATVLDGMGKGADARNMLEEAIALRKTLADAPELGRLYSLLASMTKGREQEEARRAAVKSAAAGARSGDEAAVENALLAVAKEAIFRNPEEAREALLSALKSRLARNAGGCAEIYHNLGNLDLQAGNREAAEKWYNAAYDAACEERNEAIEHAAAFSIRVNGLRLAPKALLSKIRQSVERNLTNKDD
ncbi:CHAT domain-containing protein [Roseibium sp. HPY-6]|uniref:CHAT domain-containing protein n=1 Tax=Roseibium sp. HPY-6 TaxID=3229852 RepID=UPI00338F0E96